MTFEFWKWLIGVIKQLAIAWKWVATDRSASIIRIIIGTILLLTLPYVLLAYYPSYSIIIPVSMVIGLLLIIYDYYICVVKGVNNGA